jgi:hypothetical protein
LRSTQYQRYDTPARHSGSQARQKRIEGRVRRGTCICTRAGCFPRPPPAAHHPRHVSEPVFSLQTHFSPCARVGRGRAGRLTSTSMPSPLGGAVLFLCVEECTRMTCSVPRKICPQTNTALPPPARRAPSNCQSEFIDCGNRRAPVYGRAAWCCGLRAAGEETRDTEPGPRRSCGARGHDTRGVLMRRHWSGRCRGRTGQRATNPTKRISATRRERTAAIAGQALCPVSFVAASSTFPRVARAPRPRTPYHSLCEPCSEPCSEQHTTVRVGRSMAQYTLLN